MITNALLGYKIGKDIVSPMVEGLPFLYQLVILTPILIGVYFGFGIASALLTYWMMKLKLVKE